MAKVIFTPRFVSRISLLLVLGIALVSTIDFPMDETKSVFLSTDANFEELKSSTKYFVVEFYFDECQHCKNFAPIYSKIAESFNKHPEYSREIRLAKHNIVTDSKIPTGLDLGSFPAVLLFEKGKEDFIEYGGEMRENDFLRWVNKKTFQPAVLLNTKDIEGFISEANGNKRSAIIAFTDETFSGLEANISKIAKKDENFDYAICREESCFEFGKPVLDQKGVIAGYVYAFLTDGTVKILKNQDQMTTKTLRKWVEGNGYPSVLSFDDISSELIFGKYYPGVFLYRNSNDPNRETYDSDLLKVATEIRSTNSSLYFLTVGNDTLIENKFHEHFNNTYFPRLVIHDTSDPNVVLKSYAFDGELSYRGMIDFTRKFLAGKLTPSNVDSLPDDSNKEDDSKTFSSYIIPAMFKEMVIESEKSVLLYVYKQDCDICVKHAVEFERLARSIMEPSLQIARLDITHEGVKGHNFNKLPSIIFYGEKSKNSPVEMTSDDFSYEGLKKFLDGSLGKVTEDITTIENLEKEIRALLKNKTEEEARMNSTKTDL